MNAVLLIQFLMLLIVPPKAAVTQTQPTHGKAMQRHEAEELCELSKAHWYTDPKKAIAFGKQAIEAADAIQDKTLLAQAYNNTGAGFFNLGDYNTAADYYYKAIRLREAIADTAGLSASYSNIGSIYNSQRNYNKALTYYTKALRLAELVQDTLGLSRAFNNMGNVYMRQEKYETALYYYLKALPLKEAINDPKNTTSTLINIGYTYQKQGKYTNALHYLQRGLAFTIKFNNLHDRIYAYRGLAETYMGLQDVEKAILYGKQSLEIARQTQSKTEAKTSADVLHKIYKEAGDYKQAYLYLSMYAAYNDSINTEEVTRQTTSFQVKYETAQKEKENMKLLAEHELHKKEIEHQAIIQYATIVLLALALTVVVVAYRGNRRMKRLNKMLYRKNKKVSKYSENIKKQKNELATQALVLQQQKEELEKLNNVKDKLFSVIAHDLRGPLVSLKSLLQVVAMGRIQEDQFTQFAKVLETEQQNTLWLVDNLLLWARSQMQGTTLKPEPLNLHTLADNSIKLLTSQANRKGIHFENLAQPDLAAFADTDTTQLVLRNLLTNAIKFCNEGDLITIETTVTDDQMVQVTIRDTGVGIAPDKVEKLFGLRTYTTLGTAKEKGSGLGLAMCRDFVESNHGNIWVESTPGTGSSFIFTLPLATQPAALAVV